MLAADFANKRAIPPCRCERMVGWTSGERGREGFEVAVCWGRDFFFQQSNGEWDSLEGWLSQSRCRRCLLGLGILGFWVFLGFDERSETAW